MNRNILVVADRHIHPLWPGAVIPDDTGLLRPSQARNATRGHANFGEAILQLLEKAQP